VSVHLDALADEVFAAADAQARSVARVERLPFGEIWRSPGYPDLFFLNGINQLVAPGWTVENLERAIAEHLSGIRQLRVTSRDRETVARLGPRLLQAGYRAECLLAMVQVAPGERAEKGDLEIRPVQSQDDWRAFEALIRQDTDEHGWSSSMTEQLLRLCRQQEGNESQVWLLGSFRGKAVARLGLYQHARTGYLHAIYTRPGERRRGAGSALTEAASRHAVAAGCERVTLDCTRDSFLPAFYHELGFRAVGEIWIWTRPTGP